MTEQATQLTIEAAGALAPLVTPDQVVARVDAGAVLVDVRSDAGRVSITTDAREASHSPQVLRRVECRRLALAGLWLGGPFAFQQAAHRGGAEAHGAPSVLARSRAYPFSHAAVQIGALAPPIARLQSLLYRPPAPKP